jgi:hypothetical protein
MKGDGQKMNAGRDWSKRKNIQNLAECQDSIRYTG